MTILSMPPEAERHKLRLKLPNGAELEAEGSAEFILGERRQFLALQAPPARSENTATANLGPADTKKAAPAWENLIEYKGSSDLQLRSKLSGDKTEKDACLVLLAAAKAILHTQKPTAAQLARWLRASGYPIARVDRALQNAISQGEILASGSRRARRYELSGPGLAKAYGLAYQLASFIRPAPAE